MVQQNNNKPRAAVVVMGDIGRSPRMQYHATSLAQEGYIVDLIGYRETDIPTSLSSTENVNIIGLPLPPTWLMILPSILRYGAKAIFTCIILLKTLLSIAKPNFILVQNPPAIPTLPICYLCAKLRQIPWFVDWHNYSWSIMALRHLRRRTLLVRLLEWVEVTFGRFADGGFCVTKAMQQNLRTSYGISAVSTLYDKPPTMFRSMNSDQEKHSLFFKLAARYKAFRIPVETPHEQEGTAFTTVGDGSMQQAQLNDDRPALLISSSSWTEDDAVDILVDALKEYDQQAERLFATSAERLLPDLVVALTGKGPTRCYYEELLRNLSFKHVQICFMWLDFEDYAKLLGAADIGICVHNSSSQLDLPMKIIDMFGAELPVLALDYPCLSQELVVNGQNGFVFADSQQLAKLLIETLDGFPQQQKLLDSCRVNIRREYLSNDNRWHACWKGTVLPVLSRLSLATHDNIAANTGSESADE